MLLSSFRTAAKDALRRGSGRHVFNASQALAMTLALQSKLPKQKHSTAIARREMKRQK